MVEMNYILWSLEMEMMLKQLYYLYVIVLVGIELKRRKDRLSDAFAKRGFVTGAASINSRRHPHHNVAPELVNALYLHSQTNELVLLLCLVYSRETQLYHTEKQKMELISKSQTEPSFLSTFPSRLKIKHYQLCDFLAFTLT